MTDTPAPVAQPLVKTIQALIDAGDDIRCYPSGAVGFDEWYEARDAAQLLIGQWVDEDGTWPPTAIGELLDIIRDEARAAALADVTAAVEGLVPFWTRADYLYCEQKFKDRCLAAIKELENR